MKVVKCENCGGVLDITEVDGDWRLHREAGGYVHWNECPPVPAELVTA